VDQVTEYEINNSVLAPERDCRFGSLLRKGIESGSFAAGEDKGEYSQFHLVVTPLCAPILSSAPTFCQPVDGETSSRCFKQGLRKCRSRERLRGPSLVATSGVWPAHANLAWGGLAWAAKSTRTGPVPGISGRTALVH